MDLLELGIAAVRAGKREEARMYLEAVTMAEPDNAQGFLWLSFVLDDRKLAARCLERVLEIDPENEQAKKGLAWLRQQSGAKTGPLPPQLSDAEFNQLVQLLKHSNEQYVVKAIRYLGQAGSARAVQPLMDVMLNHPSKLIQGEARTALIAVGTPAIDTVLHRMMDETDMEIANHLAAILARVRSMAALTACREVVDHAHHPAAQYAMVLNLTTSVHGEAALSLVREYIVDRRQDLRARTAIVAAIGQAVKSGGMDANIGVSLLMELQIEQAVPMAVRQATLIGLGISSHPSAARYLSMAVSDSDPQMRVTAVDALGRFSPPQVELLEKLARGNDSLVRARAHQVLTQLEAALKQKKR